MAAQNKSQARAALTGGVIAGAAGGLALTLYTVASNVLTGGELWAPMKFAGAPLMGERGLEPGFDALAVYVGLGSHFAVSIAWGALFGLLFYGFSLLATLIGGAVWGLVVWLAMHYVVLPIVGLGAATLALPISTAILTHLLFGLCVAAVFLPFQRELPRSFLGHRAVRRA